VISALKKLVSLGLLNEAVKVVKKKYLNTSFWQSSEPGLNSNNTSAITGDENSVDTNLTLSSILRN